MIARPQICSYMLIITAHAANTVSNEYDVSSVCLYIHEMPTKLIEDGQQNQKKRQTSSEEILETAQTFSMENI